MHKRAVLGSLVLVLVMGVVFGFGVWSCFAEESITITTYYPSPYGSYKELRADQMAIGSAYRDPVANPLTDGNLIVSGNVGIGTASPTYKLQLNGQPAANGYTLWTNYSDRRLKENIEGLGNGVIDKIMKLKPSTFNYNEKYYQITGYSKEDYKLRGFVAQEIQEVFPEMVRERQIGKETYLDTNLTNLQIYLVKAIQEQQDIIKAQQLEIDGLKVRLDKLEEK